jgi:histone-lysine N-methyltransferase SETMAR
MPRGQTINSDLYSMPCRSILRELWSNKYVAEILLQHDNARPHTSLKIQETITKLEWNFLPHPPYFPDLLASDFNLFGALKNTIRGKRFGNDEDVIDEVKKWLRVQSSNWYKKGMYTLFFAVKGC